VIGKKHWMIEKDKQIRRIRRRKNKKNNESNQIVWMWFIKQKTTKKHAQFSCIIKLYVEIKTKTMIQSKFPIFSELSFHFKQLFLTRYLLVWVVLYPLYFSMTLLLTYNVAHSTRPSFRLKTNTQPVKKSLAVSWVKGVKNWMSF
jgi:hypothetical protein